MIGQLSSSETACKALRIKRPHGCVPFVPFRDQPIVDVRVSSLEICSLHWILDYIEQEGVVPDLQVLPMAAPAGCVLVVLEAPEQPRRRRRGALRRPGEQTDAARGEGGVGNRPRRGKQGREPIHVNRHLVGYRGGRNLSRPP